MRGVHTVEVTRTANSNSSSSSNTTTIRKFETRKRSVNSLICYGYTIEIYIPTHITSDHAMQRQVKS